MEKQGRPTLRLRFPLPLLALILAVSLGLTFYWAIREEGVYRFLADLQRKWFHEVNPELTGLLTWAAVVTPMILLATVYRSFSRWSEEKAVASSRPDPSDLQGEEALRKITRFSTSFQRARFVIVSWALLVVGTVAGLWKGTAVLRGDPPDWVGLILSFIASYLGLFLILFRRFRRRQ